MFQGVSAVFMIRRCFIDSHSGLSPSSRNWSVKTYLLYSVMWFSVSVKDVGPQTIYSSAISDFHTCCSE